MKFHKAETLLLILLALSSIDHVQASDDDDDEVKLHSGRKIAKFQASRNDLEIESESRNEKEKTKFLMKFVTEGVPRFILRYFAKSSDSSSKVRVRAGLLRLIEYNDTISARTSPRQLNFAQIGKNQWSDMSKKEDDPTVINGVNVRSVQTSAVWNNDATWNNLNITVKVYVADADVEKDGFQLSPNGIKFSLFFDNYRCAFQNSRLALVTGLWSKNSIKFRDSSNSSVNIGGAGSFEWEKSVTVDGKSQDVSISRVWSLSEDSGSEKLTDGVSDDDDDRDAVEESKESARLLALTFPCGQNIYWDPEILLGQSSKNAGSKLAGSPLAILLTLLMTLLALF